MGGLVGDGFVGEGQPVAGVSKISVGVAVGVFIQDLALVLGVCFQIIGYFLIDFSDVVGQCEKLLLMGEAISGNNLKVASPLGVDNVLWGGSSQRDFWGGKGGKGD